MRLEDVKKILETTGLQIAYNAFPEGEAPELPYICYSTPNTNNFSADGQVYFSGQDVQIELYTKVKDIESEEKVEKALSSFFWQKTETWIETEKCFKILYEMEV